VDETDIRAQARPNPAEHLKAHRWPKGKSGNPGGRARGTSIRGILRKVLAQTHGTKSYYELLGELIYREAMKGKAPFVRELLDRVERPVRDERQPGAAGGQTVVVFRIVEAEPPEPVTARQVPLALPPGDGHVNARPVEPR
jgi:hypothetical protein